MNIYIASDHAGIELKKTVINFLNKNNFPVTDLGPANSDSVDYPDYANLVCEKLKISAELSSTATDFGILICGTGQGMCMRANKFSHIRAAIVYNSEIAQLAREHNNANIICLGARFCNSTDAENWINIFLKTKFSEGRHAHRVAKLGNPVS